MPAIVPFIPLIAQGVGMLAGKVAGKKATASAQQRSPEEQASLTGATQAAGGAGEAATSLMKQSQPYISKPAGYYGTLLSGNRAAMSQATAAPRAQLEEQYGGAEASLGRSGIRGAARDVLTGNLRRQKAGQIGGLTPGVQPWAAGQLGTLGTNVMQTAAPLYGTSGNIYSNLLGEGAANRRYARGEGEKTGTAIGKLASMAGTIGAGMAGGDDAPLASRQTVPNMGKLPTGYPGSDFGDYR